MTPTFWNIGIAFSERKLPTTTPMPAIPTQRDVANQLRGRNHNPKWTLLVEPVYAGNERYTSGFVTSYEIEINQRSMDWEVICTQHRGVYDDQDEIVAILDLGGIDGAMDMTGLDDWIKGHAAASNGDNPCGHPEWYSATWVIRVLCYMNRTRCTNLTGKIATRELHGFILQRWNEVLRDYYSQGKNKQVAFASLFL